MTISEDKDKEWEEKMKLNQQRALKNFKEALDWFEEAFYLKE